MNKKEFEAKARPFAKDLLDYAKKQGEQYGITDVKISIGTGEELKSSIENGDLAQSVSGASWSVSVTLFVGKRKMAFAKNRLDETALKAAIDQNMAVIHLVPENQYDGLLESDKVYKGRVEDLDLYDKAPPSQEELLAYGLKMEAAAFAQPGVKTARNSSITQKSGHTLTIATNGLDRLNSRTIYQASISAVAADANGNMEIAYDGSMARHFKDMAAPEDVGATAGKKAVAKLGSTLPESKTTSIILSPDAAQTFFGSVLSAIDGGAAYRDETFLKDKIGQKVMNSSITIVDDPTIERGLSSMTDDSTGMKAERLVFIEDGVMKQYNVSLTEARQLGIDPIGRNDGPTNVCVLSGTVSPEVLMADIKDGFYINSFNGGGANVNNGVFSRQAQGNVIKDGKVTDQVVSGFVVAGNLKKMFMDVVVANDAPKLPDTRKSWSVPTARIDGIKISGR